VKERSLLKQAFQAPGNREIVEAMLSIISRERALSCALSFQMPLGYEDAHASYDPDSRTIHLNQTLLAGSRVTCAYHFLHELRHAWQYQRMADFPAEVVRSLDYVVLYDGLCYKRMGKEWRSCRLEGGEAYFTDIYLSQPHELDAGNWAFRIVKDMVEGHQLAELKDIHRLWCPSYRIISEEDMLSELDKVYGRIDVAISLMKL
jgi:hypothetical protein